MKSGDFELSLLRSFCLVSSWSHPPFLLYAKFSLRHKKTRGSERLAVKRGGGRPVCVCVREMASVNYQWLLVLADTRKGDFVPVLLVWSDFMPRKHLWCFASVNDSMKLFRSAEVMCDVKLALCMCSWWVSCSLWHHVYPFKSLGSRIFLFKRNKKKYSARMH